MTTITATQAQAYLKKIPSTLCGVKIFVHEWTEAKRAEHDSFVRSYKGSPIDMMKYRKLMFKISVTDEFDQPIDCNTDELPNSEIDKLNALSDILNSFTAEKLALLKKSLTITGGSYSSCDSLEKNESQDPQS